MYNYLSIIDDKIITKGFRKSTATNALLHYDSYHPPHVKRSLPYSQFLRLRRVNSDYSIFLQQSLELTERLRKRGYDETVITSAFTRAIHQDRDTLLQKRKKFKKKEDRSIFSFQCPTVFNKVNCDGERFVSSLLSLHHYHITSSRVLEKVVIRLLVGD